MITLSDKRGRGLKLILTLADKEPFCFVRSPCIQRVIIKMSPHSLTDKGQIIKGRHCVLFNITE